LAACINFCAVRFSKAPPCKRLKSSQLLFWMIRLLQPHSTSGALRNVEEIDRLLA
jgi:hypothetical protein